jgi:alpha-glucosidase
MEQAAVTRTLRVPAGADWVDVWTGDYVAGGTTATVAAPLDGPPPLFARAGSAMLVDLAKGGWRPGPYARGVWLFPPRAGAFDWSAVEDSGDGDGPLDCWRISGVAGPDRIELTVTRDGPGGYGDASIAILLPPGDNRRVIANGGGAPTAHAARHGVTVTV